MIGPKSVWCWGVTLAVAGLVAPAAPAQETVCRLCTAPAVPVDSPPATPLRLEVRSRLNFDSLVFAGPGSGQLLLAADGTLVPLGGISTMGARAMPGSVTIIGEPGRQVRVVMPSRVYLQGERGTIEIDSVATDLPAFPTIDRNGELTFRFGGKLKIDGDLDGSFRGEIDIAVDYL